MNQAQQMRYLTEKIDNLEQKIAKLEKIILQVDFRTKGNIRVGGFENKITPTDINF